MNRLLQAIPLIFFLNSCSIEADEPQEASRLLRGDFAGGDNESADAVVKARWLWPAGDVYAVVQTEEPRWYNIWGSPALGAEATKMLHVAAKQLAENTPVRVHLIEDKSETSNGYYLDIVGNKDDVGGGRASLGTSYTLRTRFGLVGDLTFRAHPNSIRHELGHVAGLYHTQQRSDRNDHVRVHWNRVKTWNLPNFLRSSSKTIGPYDTKSIMHYGSYSFSTTKDCATITKLSASGSCKQGKKHLIPRQSDYSVWNYVALSALYCLHEYCGENCATVERCETKAVQRNLMRLEHWEETGESILPRELAICGDGAVDAGEECDGKVRCNADCTLPACADGDTCEALWYPSPAPALEDSPEQLFTEH